MESLEFLQKEKERLEKELVRVSSQINEKSSHSAVVGDSNIILNPGSKAGYLFKWQDRSLGFGGTKWDLRYFVLKSGTLSYYLNHNDRSPRYSLTLKNCAVRDDGFKQNRKFRRNSIDGEVSLKTVGAYYHVFSLYQRPKGSTDVAEYDDEDDIIPLLRFSSESLAEKNQWMELLSLSCAYCDSDYFKVDSDGDELNTRSHGAVKGTSGTLPMLIFADPEPAKMPKSPSNTTMKKISSHIKLNKSADSAKSDPKKKTDYPPSKPMHRDAGASYLSDEAPMQNYRGLLNLGLIILAISNFRILLATTKEYGFVLKNLFSFGSTTNIAALDIPFVSGMLLLNVFVIFAYGIELSLSSGLFNEAFGMTMHVLNTNASIFIPMWIVWSIIESPLNGVILMMSSVILWMKLISYVHSNKDYRQFPERGSHTSTLFIQHLDESAKTLSYPMNITLKNIYYFWFAPTLTYQIVFPRLKRRNFPRILTLLARLFICVVLMAFLIAQVVSPTLSKMLKELEEDGQSMFSIHIFAEYLLRLGMASTYIWLLVFYGYFHVFFNLLSEILRFGDRVFYRDWWNASNLSSYWRLWNLPVHYWLVRHLYFPCIRKGMSKNMGMFIVFFFSAIMHEVLISIPFHMLRTYSFFGMMSQIPLVMLTKYIDKIKPGSSLGNIIFWLSFCILGQPMAVILYTIDYWKVKSESVEIEPEVLNVWDKLLRLTRRDEL